MFRLVSRQCGRCRRKGIGCPGCGCWAVAADDDHLRPAYTMAGLQIPSPTSWNFITEFFNQVADQLIVIGNLEFVGGMVTQG